MNEVGLLEPGPETFSCSEFENELLVDDSEDDVDRAGWQILLDALDEDGTVLLTEQC